MAKNFVQPGKTLTLVAPTGGVTTGVGLIIGAIFVIALQTVLAGVSFDGAVEGVWDIAKVSAQAWTTGDKIYFDTSVSQATNVKGSNQRFIGIAAADAANPSATGRVRLNGDAAMVKAEQVTAASHNDAGAVTLTAAELLGGVIVVDTNGAGRTYTLPTAALLVAAIPGVRVGDVVDCLIVNGADAAEVLTLAAGAGGAFDANQQASSRVIGQNTSKLVRIRITNIGAGTEAYVVYA